MSDKIIRYMSIAKFISLLSEGLLKENPKNGFIKSTP